MQEERRYDILVYPDETPNKKAAVAAMPKIKSAILGHPQKLTIREISALCGRGKHPFAPIKAQGKGTLRAANWVSQQIYALDFDNDEVDSTGEKHVTHKPYYLSPKEAVSRSKRMGYSPVFGYTTLSNYHNHERFRLVYVLDEPCVTKEEHDAVYAALASAFIIEDRCLMDTSCREQSRVFFGGSQTFSLSYRSILSKKELVEKGKELLSGGIDKKATPSKPAPQKNELNKLIEALKHDTDLIQRDRKTAHESLETPVFMRARGGSTIRWIKGKSIYNIYNILDKDTILLSSENKNPDKPAMMRVSEDFVSFCLHNIPFETMFGVELGQKFRCVMPSHEDVHPSANIFIGKDGIRRYKCHGCGRHFNIFSFIQEITGCSFVTACRLVSTIFGIPYETEWQGECRDQISHYISFLGGDYFDSNFGILKKYLLRRRAMTDFILLLNIMSSMVMDSKAVNSEKPMFCISLAEMRKKYSNYGRNILPNSLYEKIKMFAHLGLIEIVPDDQIPTRTLKVLRECQENNEREYRTSCYHIPLGSKQVLEHAIEVILSDKKDSVRAKSLLSHDGAVMATGEESANKVFVQQTNEDVTAEIPKFYERYKKAVRNLFAKKGWTTEREIIDRMHYLDKKKRAVYSAFCLPDMIKHDLVQVLRFSKDVESKYSINNKKAKLHYGSSKVMVPGANLDGKASMLISGLMTGGIDL